VRDTIAIVIAVACGLALAAYDLRTDDTGIEVGLLLIASIVLTVLAPRRWWVIALAVGAFIPLIEASQRSGPIPPGTAALGVTILGALIGFAIARVSRGTARA
jgi:hypothetical protein